jgi:hypothetical protein
MGTTTGCGIDPCEMCNRIRSETAQRVQEPYPNAAEREVLRQRDAQGVVNSFWTEATTTTLTFNGLQLAYDITRPIEETSLAEATH